ncbi:MAG: hypothetical protein AB7Q17_09550 [Phycisphaerae bacterium]
MNRTSRKAGVAALAILCVSLAGCPAIFNPGVLTVSRLSDIEKDGALAAVRTVEAMLLSLVVTQTIADLPALIPPDPFMGEFTIGACPQITVDVGPAGRGAVDVTINFGAGCQPVPGVPLTVAGNATGVLDANLPAVQLNFNGLTANGATLTGGVDVVYSRDGTFVRMTGGFDVRQSSDGTSYAATGTGGGGLDRATSVARLSNYDGCIGNSTGEWDANVADVQALVSAGDGATPNTGSVTLMRSDARMLQIIFDANTPAEGTIKISVDGGDFFVANIADLLP